MTGLNIIYLLIMIGMIYAILHWHIREYRRRRAFERQVLRDRKQVREVAERAASEAAACTALLNRLSIIDERHLRLAPDQNDV